MTAEPATVPRIPRLPSPPGPPADACECGPCSALSVAIDADAEARRAVREAAGAVDKRHGLQSAHDPKETI